MRTALKATLSLGSLIALVLAAGPAAVDLYFNPVHPEGAASDKAKRLYRTLDVADLHADSLLWGRPLLRRSGRGHADVPRLIEARVALQVFSIVSRVPWPIHATNDPYPDSIRWTAWLQRWPRRTWGSPRERTLYLASRLRTAAAASGGKLTLIGSRAELRRYLERRRREPDITAGLLSIEGAHALEGDLSNLDAFHKAGVRMISPAHFFDSEIGGSAHGRARGGLTPLGRRWLREMEKRRMIVDVAHASPATVSDILAAATRPVVASHTGVRGTCDNPRNLSDDQLRGIARAGGLVGVGFWAFAVCGEDLVPIARAIRHAADVMGVRHVALGSDFDGAVATPFDVTGLDRLVEALLAERFSPSEIRRIMGENVLEFLERNLP